MNENHVFTEDLRDDNPQNVEPEVQGEKSTEADEDDDIPIVNIMSRIIDNVAKSQESASQDKEKDKYVEDVDEETESDEEPVVIVIKSITCSVAHRANEKKKKKVIPSILHEGY